MSMKTDRRHREMSFEKETEERSEEKGKEGGKRVLSKVAEVVSRAWGGGGYGRTRPPKIKRL